MIARRKPLPRSSKPLRRRAPVKKRNEARLAKRRADQFGKQAELARRSPCFTCGQDEPSQAAHVGRSRGAGGKAAQIIALCHECHSYAHQHGERALERLFGLEAGELVEEAARLARVVAKQDEEGGA